MALCLSGLPHPGKPKDPKAERIAGRCSALMHASSNKYDVPQMGSTQTSLCPHCCAIAEEGHFSDNAVLVSEEESSRRCPGHGH